LCYTLVQNQKLVNVYCKRSRLLSRFSMCVQFWWLPWEKSMKSI